MVVDCFAEPLAVRAPESQLARAVGNLVRNAIEAIDSRGEIVVKTRGNGLVVAPRQGQVLPPVLTTISPRLSIAFNCVANQVPTARANCDSGAAHGKRLSEAVDHHVDVAALVASKTRTVFRQAGPY